MSIKTTLLVAVLALAFAFLVSTDTFADGVDTDNIVLASATLSEPRLCEDASWEDTTYLCISLKNEGLTFTVLAPGLAKRAGLTLEEFLSLNEWDKQYLAQPIEPGVSYLYRVTHEAYVALSSN